MRYGKVPKSAKDERFPSHIEAELADISRRKDRKGEAVGENTITSKNISSRKLVDIEIKTTTTKIPHGLGVAPSEYNVIVKKPAITSYKLTYHGFTTSEDIYHGLGVEPRLVAITDYDNAGPNAVIKATYVGNTEYVRIGPDQVGQANADVFFWAGSRTWVQVQNADAEYLYLRSDDVTLTVDIIVKE